MKNEIKKYLFEIVVIFIGITISFFFESWRKNREEHLNTRKQLTLLRNDLSRTTAWIEQIDSGYNDMISGFSILKNGEDMSEEEFSSLMFEVFDKPIDFPLRDLSPYLNQVSRLNDTNISSSDKIITSVAFIQTLVREDYELNKSISDYVDTRLWSKLGSNNFVSKVLDAEKTWTDTTIVWTEKRYSIESFVNLDTDLSFVEMKIRKILIVHDALKRRIGILKEDLSKV